MMDELDRFEQLVIDALARVHQSYYSTVYNNVESFKAALYGRQGKFVDDDFERYGERVFCYEFYHQLRLLIDAERKEDERKGNPHLLSGTQLQGEVEKWQILGLLERFGLERLSKEFVPDFLMHSPGNVTSHPFVIEVKCINNLTANAMLYDLEKINEFLSSYNYQRGLFISINSDYGYLKDIIGSITHKIGRLTARDRIKVICKHDQNAKHNIYQL
jgi:hypothetical protein